MCEPCVFTGILLIAQTAIEFISALKLRLISFLLQMGSKETSRDNSKQLTPVNEDQKEELTHVTNSGCC